MCFCVVSVIMYCTITQFLMTLLCNDTYNNNMLHVHIHIHVRLVCTYYIAIVVYCIVINRLLTFHPGRLSREGSVASTSSLATAPERFANETEAPPSGINI